MGRTCNMNVREKGNAYRLLVGRPEERIMM
jgi:hypothetical protein